MNAEDEWDQCHNCTEAQPSFRLFSRKWSGILEETWKIDLSYFDRWH